MLKNKVFKAVGKESVPSGTTIIDSTWTCKLKLKQVDVQSCDSANIHAPVTKNVTARSVLVLMLEVGWVAHSMNVKGVFLHGKCELGEKVYMQVPEGWEHFYHPNAILLLLCTIYELKQATMAF